MNKSENRIKISLLVLFLLSLTVRLVYTLTYDGPVINWAEDDEQNYIGFAKAIQDQGLQTNDFSRRYYYENRLMNQPWDLIPPGYPFVIYLFLQMFGEKFVYLFLFQSLLSSLIPVVFYLLLRELMPPKYALWMSAWAVFYYPYIRYSPTVLKEIYLCILFLSIVYLMIVKVRKITSLSFFVYVFLFIVLLYFDERFLPYLLLFPGIQFFVLKIRTKTILLAFFAIAVCLIPWNVVLFKATGRFNYMSNRVAYFKMDEQNQQRRTSFHSYARFKLMKAVTSFKRYSSVYRSTWSFKKNIVVLLQYGMLVPLFWLGFYYLFKRRNKTIFILTFVVLTHLAIHLVLWGQHRYRYPVDAFFAVVAFWGGFQFLQSKKKRIERQAECSGRSRKLHSTDGPNRNERGASQKEYIVISHHNRDNNGRS